MAWLTGTGKRSSGFTYDSPGGDKKLFRNAVLESQVTPPCDGDLLLGHSVYGHLTAGGRSQPLDEKRKPLHVAHIHVTRHYRMKSHEGLTVHQLQQAHECKCAARFQIPTTPNRNKTFDLSGRAGQDSPIVEVSDFSQW